MPLIVNFELHDDDLAYFRKLMRESQDKVNLSDTDRIVDSTKRVIDQLASGQQPFVSKRVNKLKVLIAMLEDKEWQISEDEKIDVIKVLSYFCEEKDLIPDDIPVIGLLDDVIMIELVAAELDSEIQAFTEFNRFRDIEGKRIGNDEVKREQWIQSKRRELHHRIRIRRNSRRNESSSTAIFR